MLPSPAALCRYYFYAAPEGQQGLFLVEMIVQTSSGQASITVKRKVFPTFLDTERGDQYVLDEEPRDPETT